MKHYLTQMPVTINRFGLVTRFTGLYDTDRDYILQNIATHTLVFLVMVFTNLLVSASNRRRSPTSWFPNCPRASPTATLKLLSQVTLSIQLLHDKRLTVN
jgi:hypothetical protein